MHKERKNIIIVKGVWSNKLPAQYEIAGAGADSRQSKMTMQTGNDTNYALALAKAILGCKSIWGSLIIRPWEEPRIIELAQRVKEIEERDSGPA